MKDFFNRKTFDPVNNETDKSTLTVLRRHGRNRAKKNQPSTAMKWVLSLAKNGAFLDLGCGDSPDAIIASKSGFSANGFDLFPPTDKTKNFIQADIVESIPFPDNSIDAVVSQAMVDLIEPTSREHFYREVNRILKPGGVFACYIQWLQPGWGFDMDEEQCRAKKVFGKIQKKPQGFVVIKEGI